MCLPRPAVRCLMHRRAPDVPPDGSLAAGDLSAVLQMLGSEASPSTRLALLEVCVPLC